VLVSFLDLLNQRVSELIQLLSGFMVSCWHLHFNLHLLFEKGGVRGVCGGILRHLCFLYILLLSEIGLGIVCTVARNTRRRGMGCWSTFLFLLFFREMW
jgi:hypothetical protein